jgi:hypothetical protein
MPSTRELHVFVPGAAALATLLLAACVAGTPAPEPAAGAPSEDAPHTTPLADPLLTAACDTVRELLAAAMTDSQLLVAWGPFSGSLHGDDRLGCTFAAADSLPPFLPHRPLDHVWIELERDGWVAVPAYSADGPEGRLAGLRRGSILCVLQHFWNAGSDDERAADWSSSMWYEVRAECSSDTLGVTAP